MIKAETKLEILRGIRIKFTKKEFQRAMSIIIILNIHINVGKEFDL